jgi:methionyl-tRNA formyltransferase
MTPLKIVFAGTPTFSVPALQALTDGGHDVMAVYTQPDRPAGRGRKLTASPVKLFARERGLAVYQPSRLRDPGAIESLHSHGADLMVVVAYGLLLPKNVLDIPRLGCVNVHASVLPRWRGAAPIQRAILAGDEVSGVTIMQMEEGLDTGAVFLTRRIPLDPRETGGTLHDKLSVLGAEALMESLPGIADGSLVPQAQNDGLATYAKKLGKEEADVDWRRTAAEIDRLIRAFDPWPVAQTRLRGETLRLWGGTLPGTDAGGVTPGTVVATSRDGIDVATGNGVLRITRLQPPGKRRMSAGEFLNAHELDGELFG